MKRRKDEKEKGKMYPIYTISASQFIEKESLC